MRDSPIGCGGVKPSRLGSGCRPRCGGLCGGSGQIGRTVGAFGEAGTRPLFLPPNLLTFLTVNGPRALR